MIEVSRDTIATYLDTLFGYVDFADAHRGCVVLRGIGEKGTNGEGGFFEPVAIPAAVGMDYTTERTYGACCRWSQYHRASFIVPAVMDLKCLDKGKAGDEAVRFFTAIVVDFDKGDTDAKLDYAVQWIGPPTMVVRSGGITETGHPKRHVYWKLLEPSDEIPRIAALRKLLALKLGGDASFGRIPQVIRIPGSVHSKFNKEAPCLIEDTSGYEYDLDDLAALIESLPLMPGIVVNIEAASGNGMNFSAYHERPSIGQALTTPIHEGGDAERNRWSEFTRVAGHHIHAARLGSETLQDAFNNTAGWMLANMVPPWPEQRFKTEFRNLMNVDIEKHGPWPDDKPVKQEVLTPPARPDNMTLEHWDVGHLIGKEVPTANFLVEGLIPAETPSLVVSAGGVGKTNLTMNLGLHLAAKRPNDKLTFLGLPIAEDAGGTVVIFTAEDNEKDVHMRLAAMDRNGLLEKARGRLFVIPLMNAGGSFELAVRDRSTGNTGLSKEWAGWLTLMQKIPDLKLVVVDTLNSTMHGDENSATIIKEWLRQLTLVLSGLKAAVLVTHHTRKADPKNPIKNEEQMRAASRGSTALDAGFRAIIGIWPVHDYKVRMMSMNMVPRPDAMFYLSLLKKNGPGFMEGRRTLLRGDHGLLEDITARDAIAFDKALGQQYAWILKVIEIGALIKCAFTRTGKQNSIHGRLERMPLALRHLKRETLERMVLQMFEWELLVGCSTKSSKTEGYLDVPGGPLARNIDPLTNAEPYVIDAGAPDWPKWEDAYVYSAIHERVIEIEIAKRESLRTQQNNIPGDGSGTVGDAGTTILPWYVK